MTTTMTMRRDVAIPHCCDLLNASHCSYVYHPLRLRLDLIWSEMEERDSQVLVCALAALDRRIALGEQLMVGFCSLGKVLAKSMYTMYSQYTPTLVCPEH